MIKVKKEGLLLSPTDNKFENHGVFNPAAVEVDGVIHLLYRAANKANYSSVGYCKLSSPMQIEQRDTHPILIPLEKYEKHGIEDPRVVYIEGTYYITYTAYDGENAIAALATSKDLKTFERVGLIAPQITLHEYQIIMESCNDLNDKYLRFVKLMNARRGEESAYELMLWDKDVIFFPRKINGKFAVMHRIFPDIQIAYFNKVEDLDYHYWKDYLFHIQEHTLLCGKMHFEASYIGGGCPPIETPKGWLIIYHGVEDTVNGYVYHAGAALMDLEDPTIEIGRLSEPLFSPELEWEKIGVVNNVVFPTGTIVRDETLYIYYGAADKYVGVASLNLEELINEIINQSL